MPRDARPAGDNIAFLRQGIHLIERLDDDLFTSAPEGPFRGGVGGQFRHCFDFYHCFLDGLSSRRVDYGARLRDPATETDRGHAAGVAHRLVDRLSDLSSPQGEELEVRSDSRSPWSRSSIGRELDFLLSHTVHHYALIVALLGNLGHRPGDDLRDFGVAPSTLEHWSRPADPVTG